MKRSGILFTMLFLLSLISGWLLSKASLVGRTGINLFYKEYKFLKTWWQGGLAVLAGLFLFWGLHLLISRQTSKSTARLLHVFMLCVSVAGLYFTYNDFRTDLSHRLLGERFHLGAYLFWIGSMIIAVFYLVPDSSKKIPSTPSKTTADD